MALKISLKPGERTIIGGAVVTNGSSASTDLIIENKAPVLRQKDIMAEKEANSVCRRIYFVIQLMYIDEPNVVVYHNTYWDLVRQLIQAAPSTLGLIDQISEHILNQKYYQALKLAKKLIRKEQEVIDRAPEPVASL